ncbi:MAG: hypothetical protein IJW72_02855 [Alphaproteobacteria bacterium]|nr:hypothetical protein [Alphaproteobacteria bacterium]
MKNLEKIQQKFNLFQVGDVVNGNIVTISENGSKVKTTGGCYGTIIGDIPETLEEGSAVEVVVCDIKDRLPVFSFTPEFIFDKVSQEATVLFVGPRSVVVEFDKRPEIYGTYEASDDFITELQNFCSGTKVTASELKKDEANQDCYIVGKLIVKSAEIPVSIIDNKMSDRPVEDNDFLKPWPKEKIEDVFKSGSRKMYGKVALGKVYSVTSYGKSGKEVQFPDGQVGDLNVKFPKGCERAMVRVIFISQGKRPRAELIIGNELAKTSKVSKKDGKNKFRNEEVFNLALAQGSCYRAGGYWLGYNYKVEIKKGLPYFAPTSQDSKNILEGVKVVIKNGISFKEGDNVCAEVAFIKREGTTHNYIFDVNILKVF